MMVMMLMRIIPLVADDDEYNNPRPSDDVDGYPPLKDSVIIITRIFLLL